MTNITQILNDAADLVSRGWTQRTYARDAQRAPCPWDSPDAASWCMSGAVSRAARSVGDEVASAAYEFCWRFMGDMSAWNDAPERTQDEVVRKLRAMAIKAEVAQK